MIDKSQHIKNSLTIILDTSKKDCIQVGKFEGNPPQSQEELEAMILLDMGTICEALVAIIRSAHTSGIKNEADSMRDCIQHLNEAFVDPKSHYHTPISFGS